MTEQKKCEWKLDGETWEDNRDYVTACGEGFTFIDNGPFDNRMKFCPYCGREIKVKKG